MATRSLQFTKVQALGNHFVLLEGGVAARVPSGRPGQGTDPATAGPCPEPGRRATQGPCDWSALAQTISRHHFAVGADGLLLVGPSDVADLRMRYWDPDGMEDMCGNGLRCVAQYAFAEGLAPRQMTVETIAGVRSCEILGAVGAPSRGAQQTLRNRFGAGPPGLVRPRRLDNGLVRTAMGHPRRDPASLPALVEGVGDLTDYPLEVLGRTFGLTCVSMGTPHAVIFAGDEVDDERWPAWSEAIERHPLFPERTSVDWVQVLSRGRVRMRVWERHLGETLACGTGASAAAVAGVIHDLTDRTVDVEMKGGTLSIEWSEGQEVEAVGEASVVFRGTYPYLVGGEALVAD